MPANYASKSKLVAGDVLKLTITDNGSFIYKQIGPVPRKQMIGTLSYEEGQYKVMASGKAYKVFARERDVLQGRSRDQVTDYCSEMEESDWSAMKMSFRVITWERN